MKDSKNYSEQQILKGCIRNERKFQEILYRKHYPVMMGLCMRHTKDRDMAKEILNKGFLRVFQKLDSFRGDGSLQGWIRRIIYHAVCDHFKGQSSYNKVIFLEEYDQNFVSKYESHTDLEYQDVLKLLDELPPKTAEIFKKFILEGYSHKEIASNYGISEGTSKWHVSDAKGKLRDMIKRIG